MKKYMQDLRVLDFASEIDLSLLWDKIQRFRDLNKKNLSEEELRNEIYDVITFNNWSLIMQSSKVFKSKSRMYRIRKLEDRLIPNKDMKTTSDAWYPPSEYVKIGRLNKPGESLLYISPDISTVVEEMKVKENDFFALMVYEVIDDIKSNCIGINENLDFLDKDNKLKMRLIQDFLKEEFSRDVGEGIEHLYRISEIIAKDFFDLPPRDVQDAWCYPSIANKPGINLCLRPDIAKEKLSLIGVQMISGYHKGDDSIGLYVQAVAQDNKKGQMEYFKIGSEEQRSMFPEIISNQGGDNSFN